MLASVNCIGNVFFFRIEHIAGKIVATRGSAKLFIKCKIAFLTTPHI